MTTPPPSNYAQAVIDRMNDESPGEDPELIRLYALLALVKGDDTTLRDVHDAWSLWRTTTRPGHPSLVPFEELPTDVQELDQPYRDAISRASRPATS